ncbi:MAG: class I SAM-dependent methyltransferase [Pseudomonadota bacterium]
MIKRIETVLRQPNPRIFIVTFSILALELAFIRWAGGQVQIFAYFGNLILIVAFLGLGLGVGFGRGGKSKLSGAYPCLTVVCLIFGFSEHLGIANLRFPDPSVSLWGSEVAVGAGSTTFNLLVFIALVASIAVIFTLLGSELGAQFARSKEKSVDAYLADLAGSLAGTICFTGLTLLSLSPPAWFILGLLPLLLLQPRFLNFILVAIALLACHASTGGAIYSPYNRIEISGISNNSRVITVNRDFHQYIHDLSDASIAAAPTLSKARTIYDLPFAIATNKGSAVVVGAGTGNDAQAALRNGFSKVTAVDIDPFILEIGHELHPEGPYKSPKVVTVAEDARAFFKQYQGPKFDAVVYGLLDSHAMVSSLSTIRLDNFVYTKEAISEAWQHVKPSGHLAVGFSVFAGDFIAERIYRILHDATGVEPVAFFHAYNFGATFVISRENREAIAGRLSSLAGKTPIKFLELSEVSERQRVPSDDWPYLYVRPGAFPWLYVLVLGIIVLSAVFIIPRAYGASKTDRSFNFPMFFMGAAFLLLETRGITALSLLYGSTWIVNALVFIGILTMALAATFLVRRGHTYHPKTLFILLFVATLALWQFDLNLLNALPLEIRGVVGGLIHAIPIFFAGLLFPVLLARSVDPAAALGSNLLGAVFGGCLEYLSMVIGLSALVGIASVFYLLAMLCASESPRHTA